MGTLEWMMSGSLTRKIHVARLLAGRQLCSVPVSRQEVVLCCRSPGNGDWGAPQMTEDYCANPGV